MEISQTQDTGFKVMVILTESEKKVNSELQQRYKIQNMLGGINRRLEDAEEQIWETS